MGKIKTYTTVLPTASDKVIITDVSGSDATRNVLISAILALGAGAGFPGTLQQVTDAGNSTTKGISVGGASAFTGNLSVARLSLTAGLLDGVAAIGAAGQILSSMVQMLQLAGRWMPVICIR